MRRIILHEEGIEDVTSFLHNVFLMFREGQQVIIDALIENLFDQYVVSIFI